MKLCAVDNGPNRIVANSIRVENSPVTVFCAVAYSVEVGREIVAINRRRQVFDVD